MNWSDLPWRPSPKALRQFATLLCVFAGLAAWRAFVLGRVGLAGCFGLLALVGLLGLVWLRLIRPVFLAALVITFPVGWVVSHIALALLFYGVVTPLGLFFRMVRRDVLRLRDSPEAATYWEVRPQPEDVSRYFRTF